MKNWIDISSGPIDTPDVASHCIALRCNLRSLHVPSRPIPYLSLISTWNSSLFEWYNVKRNHWDTRCCIAMHCSPRVALHCIAAPDISMFPILHPSVLESYQYLKLFHIQLTISSKVFDRVNQFNLCPNANQYLQKVFDPFKPHNLDNLFKPVKRALTLFQRRTNFPHQRQLKPKLIVVKLSNQKSPTLSIFLHDKHRSFIMII